VQSMACRNRDWVSLTASIRFGLPYHGLSGLQVGFLVAFTQLIPEHQLQLLGAIKVRVKVSSVFMRREVIAQTALKPSRHSQGSTS
jgi:hypothetical protein